MSMATKSDHKTSFTNKLYRVVLLVCATLLTPWNLAAGAEPYNLGVAYGLTGVGADWSRGAVDAITMAVDEINNTGGLLGRHQIVLVVKDTATSPEVTARVTREMIAQDRVRTIIGTYSSATAVVLKPLAHQHKVLHIAALSNSEDITRLDPSPYTFSVVPNTYMQARATVVAVAQLARQKDWKRYVTVASDYAWGRSSQAGFVTMLRHELPELELAGEIWSPLGGTDFNAELAQIARAKPDFVCGWIAGADNVRWFQIGNRVKFFERFPYPGSQISVQELIAQADILPRGIVGLARAPFFAHLDQEMMVDFVKRYRARFDTYPNDFAVMAYDAVMALKQGAEKADSVDTEAIRNALTGATIKTTRGSLSFRKIDNQLNCSSYLGTVQDSPDYPFPILADIIEVKGENSWRPVEEIEAARAGR